MDTKTFLEQLLDSGRKLAEQGLAQGSEIATQGKEVAGQGLEKSKELLDQGLDYASEKFGLPEAGPERDKVLQNLGIGAAAGGLLALLVGTKSGRKVLSPAVKIGSLAALGGLGYKVYSDWKKSQQGEESSEGMQIAALTDESANTRSMSIIKAIIAAAKADGSIDSSEREAIVAQIKSAGLEESLAEILMEELQRPLDVAAIAAEADSPESAVEIYLASLLMADKQNVAEQQYLSALADAMNLDPVLVQQLEAEALSMA